MAPVSLQAHTDQLEVLADQAITVISVNDCIQIMASQKIVLQAGQSSITLEGADIRFACPGRLTVKGGQHLFDSGSAAPADSTRLPDSTTKSFDEAFILKDQTSGEPLANVEYRIRHEDGCFEYGRTDEHGHTHLVSTSEKKKLIVEVKT